MSETPLWRKMILGLGIGCAVFNPVYFFLVDWFGQAIKNSETAWEKFIFCGFVMSLVAVLCGTIGKNDHRAVSIASRCISIFAGCAEAFFWWFMSVGL